MKDVFLVLWRVFLLIFGFFSIAFGGLCVFFGAGSGTDSTAIMVAGIGAVSVVVGALVFVATIRALKRRPVDQGKASAHSGEEQP